MKKSDTRAGGRPGVTFEEYEKVFNKLRGPNGEPPSQRKVRRHLGTGSNTTLSAYRRRIAERCIEETGVPEPGSIDAKLLSAVQTLASQLSQEASQIAEDRVNEIQAEAKERIDLTELTLKQRLQDAQALEQRAKIAESELIEARHEVVELRQSLAAQTEELRALSATQAADRQSRNDSQRQLDEKSQTLLALLSELKTLRDTCQAQSQQITQAETALETLRDEHRSVQEEFDALKRELVESTDTNARYQIEMTQSQERVNQLQAELKHTEAGRQTDQAQAKTLIDQLKNEQLTSSHLLIANKALETTQRAEHAPHQSMLERLNNELTSKDNLLDSLQQILVALKPDTHSEETRQPSVNPLQHIKQSELSPES